MAQPAIGHCRTRAAYFDAASDGFEDYHLAAPHTCGSVEQVAPEDIPLTDITFGLPAEDGLVAARLAEGRDHAERRRLEDTQRTLVAGIDVPTYELPRLADGVDLGGLYDLAARLREQAMA